MAGIHDPCWNNTNLNLELNMDQLARPQHCLTKYTITVPKYNIGKTWYRSAVSKRKAASLIAYAISKETGMSPSYTYKNYTFIVEKITEKQVKAVKSAQLSLFN